MELCLDFEDDDFEESKKTKVQITSYNAKFCHPEWFLDVDAIENADDKAEINKFGGDHFFHQGKYLEAIVKYKKCLELLPNHHTPVWRDVLESLARSYLNLQCFDDSLEIAKQLVESSEYVSLRRQSMLLLLEVQIAADFPLKDQIQTQQCLIDLDPAYAPHWYTLYHMYKRNNDKEENEYYSNHTKQVTCLIRARLLRRALHNMACALVKESNARILNQIEEDLEELGNNKDITDAIKAWMFEIKQDDSEENDTSQSCGELLSGKKFEDKWFGWSKQMEKK